MLARFVLVRRDGAQTPLAPLYDGPYRVLERSNHFFRLQIGERTDNVSTLRLKAANTPADTVPAVPPRRGRPPTLPPPPDPPQQLTPLLKVAQPGRPTRPPDPAALRAARPVPASTLRQPDFPHRHRPPYESSAASCSTQPLKLAPQSLGGSCGDLLIDIAHCAYTENDGA